MASSDTLRFAQYKANQKLRSVDEQGFRDGVAAYGPFDSFSGIVRGNNIMNPNGNNLCVATFDKEGPFSRAGWPNGQDWTTFLSPAGHGHSNRVRMAGGDGSDEAANEAAEETVNHFLSVTKPVDGVFEIEGIRGDPSVLENRINLATGETSTDVTFSEDGVAAI